MYSCISDIYGDGGPSEVNVESGQSRSPCTSILTPPPRVMHFPESAVSTPWASVPPHGHAATAHYGTLVRGVSLRTGAGQEPDSAGAPCSQGQAVSLHRLSSKRRETKTLSCHGAA